MKIDTGKWSESELDRLLRESSQIEDAGMRIEFISRQFLRIPYKASTLIGDQNTAEELTVNFSGVDCFTFLDYVEAMRLSASFSELFGAVRIIRYKAGRLSYEDRNHFFTDWAESNREHIRDATEEIGGNRTVSVTKKLNRKGDGTFYLPGIASHDRLLHYIPPSAIDDTILGSLRTGDYAGVYSELPGLDVSHTGIIIRAGDSILLRHASSAPKAGRVVDEDFRQYITDKPGLIVLRPM